VQAPGGPEEDTDGGFAHGGWSHPYFDIDAMGPVLDAVLQRSDAILFGRRTYEVSAAAWPGQSGDPFSDKINSVTKYVASRTLTAADVTWQGAELLPADDALGAVRALREREGGDLQVYGSADLVRQLVEADLVDAYRIMLEPIVLGGGKRSFPENGAALPLELESVQRAATGVLVLHYRRAR
jgi:dihydrofolate reductase